MDHTYTINDIGWRMTIYIDTFFPCSQRTLLKLLKIMKDTASTDGVYVSMMQLLFEKVSNYHRYNSWNNEHERLLKNEALITKKIEEVGEKIRKDIAEIDRRIKKCQ